ncbi:helix-turn-helix domain-containing protein [Nocardia farcinica]|uniref:helix-turn-helix domain-containing protein n=1 Tax=Nocardia farcinica TaxID=37329 RepID=UPI001893BD2B|nr:helix-turn-helix transcriptional regulator [Nocardia farcinica]MBF6361714.1 helix-turn-helix domain-containing protein [Nocardia farcinica]
MTNVDQARKALGARLRELRKDAGLKAQELSASAGWHWSKTSRIEHGKQAPSEADLATWCRVCDAQLALPDLVATLRNVEAQWAEWRRVTATGHARRQRRSVELMTRTQLLRTYSSVLIPGLLQTEAYARAAIRTCIDFLGTVDDLDAAVAARMDRQRVLREGPLKMATLIDESALRKTVGDDSIMRDQLRHLLDVGFGNAKLVLGVVPAEAPFVYTVTTFDLWDNRMALVETISAELTVTTPSELAYYEKAWAALHGQAVYGNAARQRITAALNARTA